MTKYFDGRAYAHEKEEMLTGKVNGLISKGVVPKLVSIIIGEDEGSILYQNLKKKAAERIGALVEIRKLALDTKKEEIVKMISDLNQDIGVDGIMIQLPLPDNYSKDDTDGLINAIGKDKDVDGLREDGEFITPVVEAVMDAIPSNNHLSEVAVLGANGFEGKRIVKRLKELGYKNIFELGRSDNDLKKTLITADIVISATGQPDLVKREMIKRGVVLIDVGSPRGDISNECYEKASFVSPVPGGIGPATIANLIENLVASATGKIS